MAYGILICSHVPEIAQGLPKLLKQVAKDIPITYAGGTDENDIGTSMEKISEALTTNTADEILAFYDLGSARMNLDMAIEKVVEWSKCWVEGGDVRACMDKEIEEFMGAGE